MLGPAIFKMLPKIVEDMKSVGMDYTEMDFENQKITIGCSACGASREPIIRIIADEDFASIANEGGAMAATIDKETAKMYFKSLYVDMSEDPIFVVANGHELIGAVEFNFKMSEVCPPILP